MIWGLLGGARCGHRSHRAGLRCWRVATYDRQCSKHNRSCWHGCREAT